MDAQGTLYVVSAPSGGGKGTILASVLQRDPLLQYAVSATTRPPRQGERDGRHYHFLSEKEFERWKASGRFLEWARVHSHQYGTPVDGVTAGLEAGKDVVLELDVQGMRSVRRVRPSAVTVFIAPPAMDELERRLRARGGLSEDELKVRLRNAEEELAAKDEYDFIVINDDLESAIAEFERIIADHRGPSN
ncbi:MAG: guanylate kinase [Candidatus Hydrogenedentota bacterium]